MSSFVTFQYTYFDGLCIKTFPCIIYFIRKDLKKLLKDRIALDRRRLEEGLLLYWCLQRVMEYSLKKLQDLVIPSEIDDLIKEVSPLYHDGFIKKWISKFRKKHTC